MRRITLLLLLLGAGVLGALVLATGIDAIGAALAPVGWGIAPIVLSHLTPILLDVAAWRRLFAGPSPSLGALFGMRWIGEAINNLLPVAQIGGEVVRIRLAMVAGTDIARATASVVADVTLGAATQVVCALAAVGLLLAAHEIPSVVPVLSALALFGGGVLGFYWVQRRRGLVAVGRWARRLLPKPAWAARLGGMEPFQHALDRIYADRRAVGWACFWRLAGWVAGAGEIWLSLYFLGVPATWTDAFILEILSQAGRSAAFSVPAGIGVQEAGFVVIGMAVGLDASTALALALIRRGRDLALGLPALAAYAAIEARQSAAAGQDGAR